MGIALYYAVLKDKEGVVLHTQAIDEKVENIGVILWRNRYFRYRSSTQVMTNVVQFDEVELLKLD